MCFCIASLFKVQSAKVIVLYYTPDDRCAKSRFLIQQVAPSASKLAVRAGCDEVVCRRRPQSVVKEQKLHHHQYNCGENCDDYVQKLPIVECFLQIYEQRSLDRSI